MAVVSISFWIIQIVTYATSSFVYIEPGFGQMQDKWNKETGLVGGLFLTGCGGQRTFLSSADLSHVFQKEER